MKGCFQHLKGLMIFPIDRVPAFHSNLLVFAYLQFCTLPSFSVFLCSSLASLPELHLYLSSDLRRFHLRALEMVITLRGTSSPTLAPISRF